MKGLQVVYGVAVGPELFLELFGDSLQKLRDEQTMLGLLPSSVGWDPDEFTKHWDESWSSIWDKPESNVKKFVQDLCKICNISDPDLAIDLHWEFVHKNDNIFSPRSFQWIVGMCIQPFNDEECLEDLVNKVSSEQWTKVAEKCGLSESLLRKYQCIPLTYIVLDS